MTPAREAMPDGKPKSPSATGPDPSVTACLGFVADMSVRPCFYANDHSRDVLDVEPIEVRITDARRGTAPVSLDREGFQLLRHSSSVSDFRDAEQVSRDYVAEIAELLRSVSGADFVAVNGNAVLRFSEKSPAAGKLDNSLPARFVHIDCSDAAADDFYRNSAPDTARSIRRAAQYNVWRVMSPPPQDVPLAVCDASSLEHQDLVPADAHFDRDGEVAFSFESLLVRYNPSQRWFYYPAMTPDEVLVFKTHDTDPDRAHQVAHGAFDDPACPANAVPRASVEMRGIAYWFGQT